MGVRRQAREAAMQAVYMCDFIGKWHQQDSEFCFEHFDVAKAARPYGLDLTKGVIENLAKIDSKLTVASENWSLSRMGRVDRAILRVAAYEILFLDDIPINVGINEAIEIAKRYGSDESANFVNGVLDRVASIRDDRPRERPLKVEVEKIHAAPAADSGLVVEPIVAVEGTKASDEIAD